MAGKPFSVKEYGVRHNKVVFLLAGWTMRQFMLRLPAYFLARGGYHVIVYCYPVDILSPDYIKTRHDLLAIKEDIVKRMATLKKQGKSEFAVFGTSLGGVLATLVANESQDVKEVIFNTAGTDLAHVVWGWDVIKPWFKQELLNKNITLQQLAKEWKPISMIHNIGNFSGKDVLLYLVKKDEVVPYKLGQEFVEGLKAKGARCEVVVNKHLNHSLSCLYNLLRPKKYLEFLKR